MKTVLLTSQPARGHWNPLIRMAHELRSRGHNVVLAGPEIPEIRRYFAEQDLVFQPIRPSLSALGLLFVPWLSGFAETYYAARFFYAGIHYYARAVVKIIDAVQADLVVNEFSFLGGGYAAEICNLPHVLVYHAGLSFPGPGVPPFASGLPIGEDWAGQEKRFVKLGHAMIRMVDRQIAAARSTLGLEPVPPDFLVRPVSPWVTCVLTSPHIEAPREPLARNMYYIGPCWDSSHQESGTDFPWDRLAKEMSTVYVSLGTIFNKKPHLFQKIITAFSDGVYQVIVSAGGAYDRLSRSKLPSTIFLFKQVPQSEVLPMVDAVISHGGNNTVNETLAAGKPLLVLPVGGEQGDNASKVVFLGAGLRCSTSHVTSQEIREKVDRLIKESTFSDRARAIAAGLAETNGVYTACRFIERLLETKGPIQRSTDYPEAITRHMPMPWETLKNGE
ncbi:glycosyltransferase family 1 protein [bacterium]|nr:glycosyltransferase family 1 protein [bacterium]